jgi:hypothetical protein
MSASRGGVEDPLPRQRYSRTDRLVRAWRNLPHERQLAAFAAAGLFLTLFLPWYQETVIASGVTSLRSVSASLTGWAAFSFVEAAVLLVAAGVVTLLFVRADGQAFHVPGGDGGVITAAGVWTCLLIVWRMFDKEGTTGHGQYATASGIEWGIFIALGVAGLLAYAGTRIRLAHDPEPPLPGERPTPSRRGRRVAAARGRGGAPADDPPKAPSAERSPEPALDSTWIEPARREPQRKRPRSVGAGGEPSRPDSTQRKRPRSVGAGGEPSRPDSTRPPDPREVRARRLAPDLTVPDDLADPPTARFRRSAPTPRPAAEPDDQLTSRLDRPE